MRVGLSGEKELMEVVSGFTITEQFNETLDNANIIIRSNHRLNIKPYDEVCFENNICMLVDTFVETQESLITEQFLYKISLMSLTKWLEKIQLPNRMITHSLVDGQKTIYEYINEYLELYSPKIRVLASDGVHWETKQMFYNALSFAKYSVPCRDLGFSKPTLRQALTTLMLQVGCIPVLKKNFDTNEIELHDIDFRKQGETITELDTYCNYITRSNASDSYVNTLKIVNENVLDEGLVCNELIGFRDTDNVFLKQKENLTLQTRFPIYKVNKFLLNVFAKADVNITDIPSKIYTTRKGNVYPDEQYHLQDSAWLPQDSHWIGFLIYQYDSSANEITLYKREVPVEPLSTDVSRYYKLAFKNVVLNELEKQEQGYKVIRSTTLDDFVIAEAEDFKTISVQTNGATHISILADLEWEYIDDNLITRSGSLKQIAYSEEVLFLYEYYLLQNDITPLCVESSKRQLLNTDFLSMEDVNTIEQLSKYIYGTVGYDIGTNVIKGFSQTYNKAVGWWQEPYTYIENIFNVIKKREGFGLENHEFLQQNIFGGLPKELIAYQFSLDSSSQPIKTPFTVQLQSILNGNLFTNIFFSIEYQALNKTNVSISKNDMEINIPIEQYDSSDNSITNANDLIQVEQQKVDRLGNDVITINQRIPLSANETSYNLNDRILGEYVIFKKETQYNPYDIQIVYTASKDYVLQNYFTAIQTRYRAYEYVPYGNAVLRQENTKVSVLIDNFAINNDNSKVSYFNNWLLLSAIQNRTDYENYKFKYAIKVDGQYGYKEDLSTITAQNNILFTNVAFDSISHGIYISSTIYDDALGGLPQQWYIKSSDFLQAHITYFATEFPIFDKLYGNETEIQAELDKAYKEPRVALNSTIINSPNTNRTYYLDQQEKLNETLQFEYFTTNQGIKWTNLLQELCLLVNDKQYTKVIYFDTDKNVNEKAHDVATYYENIEDYVSFNNENNNFRILWDYIPSEYSVIKFAILENGKVKDIMSVDNSNTFVYVSLLDTKSLKVGSYRNGCLVFDEYEIAKNNVNKIVNRL